MDDIKKNIREFLKNKYEVKAYIAGHACIVEFPRRTQMPFSREFTNCYSVVCNKERCGVDYKRWSGDEKILKDIFVSLPPYAIKLFIWCDIARCCLSLGYSQELINCTINEVDLEEEDFLECVPTPLDSYDEEIKPKEKAIHDVFFASYDKTHKDFEEEAEREGVGEGFRLICSFFLEVR